MASVDIVYPLKAAENQSLAGGFRGYKSEHWPVMGLCIHPECISYYYIRQNAVIYPCLYC